jgi:hypothetical protein
MSWKTTRQEEALWQAQGADVPRLCWTKELGSTRAGVLAAYLSLFTRRTVPVECRSGSKATTTPTPLGHTLVLDRLRAADYQWPQQHLHPPPLGVEAIYPSDEVPRYLMISSRCGPSAAFLWRQSLSPRTLPTAGES